MYIYESHMSEFYYNEKYLDSDELYCSTCSDYDTLIGNANNKEEAWKLLEGKIDRVLTPEDEGYEEIYNTGGYDREYVEEFINSIPFIK